MPIIMKNSAVIRRRYFLSFHASAMNIVVFRGGTRGLTIAQANSMNGRIMNPMMRIDQPNPMFVPFSSFDKTIGNTTPPIDDPDATIPMAAARFFSKYCATIANAGNCKNATAEPMSTPCASMNW